MTAAVDQSIEQQVEMLADAIADPVASVQEVRRRILAAESDVAAWVTLTEDIVGQAHRASGPLRGISLGVKDLIDVAGIATRAGSTTTSDRPATDSAACVQRLTALGAIVQGKTVTTEFGYFQPGPTRNPHAYGHTPGGSSSGSAAAVGSGVIPLALGTQTAGSLTRPASFCGTAGMVFAAGSTDTRGIAGLSETLDSLGLLTRTVGDLRYVHSAFIGDTVSSQSPASTTLLWRAENLGALHPSIQALVDLLPRVLTDAGADVRELGCDAAVAALHDDHVTVMQYEAARTLADTFSHSGDRLSNPLRELISAGLQTDPAAYASAMERRECHRSRFFELLGDSAVIVGPAALEPAPAGLRATGSPALSRPWQLLGAPVVVVPGARSTSGLPLGVQVIGLPGHESQMLNFAAVLEPFLRALPRL